MDILAIRYKFAEMTLSWHKHIGVYVYQKYNFILQNK